MLPKDRSRPLEGAATDRDGLADLTSSYVAGLDAAMEHAARDWWFQGAMAALKQLAAAGHGFTVEHVLDLVGQPTDCHYPGVLFAVAQRQRIVEPVGARLGRDGRLVRVWWGMPSTTRNEVD